MYHYFIVMFKALFQRDGFTFPRVRAFLEVAQAGGIAKAVGSDTGKQSQYSRQIGELEEFFGTELFRKRGKAMVLSDTGKELVAVVRQSFHGFEDFALACSKQSVRVVIGGGDALLQWLVAPNLAVTSRKFPDIAVCLQNLKSSDVVSGLRDLSLDLGFVRESALPKDLGRTKMGELRYGLYVPRKLVPEGARPSFAWVVQTLPLACQYSEGEFQHQLQVRAEKGKVRLRISVECETFPQAAQLLLTETYAAVLPSIASRFLDSTKFVEVPTTWLKNLHRPVALAWNKRTMNIRPIVDKFRNGLEPLCKI